MMGHSLRFYKEIWKIIQNYPCYPFLHRALNDPTERDRKAESMNPGPEFIKLVSCSAQLSMKFFLLISVKMPTSVGILTFMSRQNIILNLSEPAKS